MPSIIACIDGSPSATAVCDYAAWASRRVEAPLTLLHVLDRIQYPAPGDLSGAIGLGSREHLLDELTALDEKRARLAREQGEHLLSAARQRVLEQNVTDVQIMHRHGSLVDTLQEVETDMHMLVVGKRGEHSSESGVGSQLESIARTLHRPMLVVTGAFKEPKQVLIAFDGSETARKGIETIARSPLFQKLSCQLLFVGLESDVMHSQLDWARQTLDIAGVDATIVVRSGEAVDVIPSYVESHAIDLLVMGAYGHSAIRRFLVGSTTTRMIQQTAVPLLLLR
ncbi:nucleotide-binding universal stress UspA family protein [Pseudomonas duriflava]|uniref:Nucleotide-binding universal stress UspA family protein n=1 Tax=Pseudomonas duriflava TaxID=459528 RepID=A0A562QFR1_9PSED|nr:universal stress protein [Pseudomonas duriflava]TWI55588.1 nucleotide-binding universal stress UspA family protein [Pseudomonas duriflava]